MTKAHTFLAGIAAIALLPAVANAQHAAYSVLNGQVQLNDVISNLHVQAASSQGTSASGVAAGNAVTVGAVEREVNFVNNQHLRGSVIAANQVEIGTAHGTTTNTAVASGNSAQVQGCCAVTRTSSDQVAVTGSQVAAIALTRVNSADTVVTATQATANNFASTTTQGYSDARAGQYSAASVDSHARVEACCNNGSITSSAVAAANAARWTGEAATIYAHVDQKNYGPVNASSRIVLNNGTNLMSGASAAGNVAELQNSWGYAQMDGYQENQGNVSASSEITLNDFGGFAVSGANAIGNSALVSNIGSDATMAMTQNNFGAVSASASFNGASSRGGVGQVSSSAVGNAMTGFACAACGSASVKMEGYATQYNSGPVTATTNVNFGTAGHIVASASAVGNSASFIAQRGGGH